MIERRRRRSQSTVVSSAPPPWRRLFGEPIFLQGEDPAAYGELLVRIRSAVKPPDMIQEMLVADVVWLEWEVLRWRRLKGSLIRARGVKALEDFVYEQLDENDDNYELYSEQFANRLAEILQHNLPEDQAENAQRLAHKYAENEREAVGKVDEILARNRVDIDDILRDARRLKAKELVHEYAQHEPDGVSLVDELLGRAGTRIEALTADALKEEFDYIERIDRLTTIAENRRNDALNEIERRRALFGEFQPRYAPRARVRALWGLSGWRGNERIADSIKKGPPGARAGGGCCSGSDRAPNFQGSAGRERNPVRGLAQLASLWLIACPASKLRHTCSDHCCRMGADCRELDGPLRPTARLSAIGTFARSTRARQANRFAERPEFLRPVRARQGLG